MGAKTWMLVYSNGEAAEKLAAGVTLDRAATNSLIGKLFPNEKMDAIEDGNLAFTNPPDDVIYAGCFGAVSIVAAKEFAGDYPSKVDPRFIDPSLGTHIYLHAMHSVVDWLAFAKWENGKLVRSLSLSPDSGILEDVGGKLAFELDFWEGKHPAVDPEEADAPDYPLVFHPLELGGAALKAFFGYQLEGYPEDDLYDPEGIPLCGCRRLKMKPWWKVW